MANHNHDRRTDLVRLIHAHHAPRCQHIKTNGTRCKSPAMKLRKYCYYHDQQRCPRTDRIGIPALEDANAVQMAIQQVVRGILNGILDNKTAGLALYGLQTAAMNLPNTSFEPEREEIIVDDEELATVNDVECDDPACPDLHLHLPEEDQPFNPEAFARTIDELEDVVANHYGGSEKKALVIAALGYNPIDSAKRDGYVPFSRPILVPKPTSNPAPTEIYGDLTVISDCNSLIPHEPYPGGYWPQAPAQTSILSATIDLFPRTE